MLPPLVRVFAVRGGALLAAGMIALAAGPAHAAAPAAGPWRSTRPRPEGHTARACSFSSPVCVHASPETPAWAARHVLRAAESALTAYRALGLPMPLRTLDPAGGRGWEVYIGSRNVYARAANAPASPAATSTAPAGAASAAAAYTSTGGVYTAPGAARAASPPVAYTSTGDVYTTTGEPPSSTAAYTSAADVYTNAAAAPGVTLADPETPPRLLDQAVAFTLLPEPTTWGCELDFEVARHAAEAVLLRLDAGAERGLLAASASYLASLVAPCAALETPAIDDFQSAPHLAITGPRPGPVHGGLLFPMFLEEEAGTGDPGRLITSLFAIASQKSDPASPAWQNEPDAFDALRTSTHFRGGSLDDLLLAFAVDRAFVGERSDGVHLPATDLYGKAGRVFFEWSVPYSSLPRRLAPARPLEPTGATYLWLDLAGAPKDAELTFVADWELPAVFRWSIVKVDKTGSEAGRVDLAGIFGSSHVERTIVLREDLAGLIVVGTFTGPLDRSAPFDPDLAPFMPHAYEVTLYGPLPAAIATPQSPPPSP